MTQLLDRPAFGFITNQPALSLTAPQKIEDDNAKRILSTASVWQLALKSRIATLELLKLFDQSFPRQLRQNYFKLIDFSRHHLTHPSKLLFYHKNHCTHLKHNHNENI